jgi:phosphoadenosine phosphosulfate reductase
MNIINEELLGELQAIREPQEMIRELIVRLGDRAAIGTSGQLTGVVMIDMAVRSGVVPRVFTIDTLRLFDETYEYFDLLEEKYGIKIERLRPDPNKIKEMVAEHGEYLFFDSPARQEYCCFLRKVEPNNRALDTLDIWISGLRRDQSSYRRDTLGMEIIRHGEDKRPILKVAPLVDWTEQKCRAYMKDHDIPVHKLLEWEQGGWRYESLGCRICTTPIGPDEPRRAGRWRWFNSGDENKECGLHTIHHDPDTKDEA